MNNIKQKATEIIVCYILNYQLFIDYAGSNAFDLVMEFLDSNDFKILKPVIEDIKYMIKDIIKDPDINPSLLEFYIDGMIDYSYRDLIDKAINSFFDNSIPNF